MRVIFMGTPDFSVPVLDALIAAGHEIAAVYCQPPRPAGRGKKERPTPVHARALALGLDVRHPVSLKGADEQQAFAALNADVAVVVAYGLILPQIILDAPKRGCLNIHASLLPRWRGAAPIHRAILAGDAETGVCIMQMEAGLDTGPVLLREAITIGAEETTGVLHDRLSAMGARLVCDALDQLDDLAAEVQSEDGVTYASKIDKAEAQVNWNQSATQIDRQIRGLSPFPGAWTLLGGVRVKLLASRVVSGAGAVGQALDDSLTIACEQGAIQVIRAQKAGKGAQDAQEFLRGTPVPKGTQFGQG
ncbi:methionyl-tRNA formyltransferase [Planktotalea frisia]|jgi:methionyl-tRNA formyltransferase|uniref:Methionyl-tRNA formyltransferase n=1 Tax=Planktotalea frisia TaxID=696762 RepID=A0A1L9NVE7_9RHOB|nr:methionyl-tRNA formyltransferase [Planktotalea frisia]OJI93229.1 methionyl-tRNA formyltransferase [Planktotalea frisia]PZX27099.1 methionyl-tRNA formyltransferase [Planktotalea frisia]